MKRFLLPILLAFLPFDALPQFSVSGKVTGLPDNEPLPGAHVLILDTYKSAVTGPDGVFNIHNLKKGEYNLRITYIGYRPFEKHLSVTSSIQLTIQLEPTAFVEDEVIILGTRAAIKDPVTSQTISSKEISALNLNRDIPFLIENSTSVVASSDAGNGMGYSTLRIRGTDMSRINVTVNGIPLNDAESQAVFWVDLPDISSSTSSIQIQRGVGTSTNGAAAFGASINLQTETSNSEPYAILNSSYGSFNTFKRTMNFGTGQLRKHWTLEGRLSKLSTNGYVDRASVNLQSYYLSGTYTGKQNLARLTVFSGIEKTYQAWDGIPSSILDTNRQYNGMGLFYDSKGNAHFYDNETDNYQQTHYQAHFAHRFSNKLFASGALHYTAGYGYYEQYREDDKLSRYLIDPVQLSQPFYLLANDTVFEPDSLISRCDLIRRKYLDNDFYGLTFALNYQQKRVQAILGGSLNTYDGNHFGTVIWTQFAGNSLKDHEWYRGTGKKTDQNIYSKVNFQATDRTNLYFDLQFRHINYKITGIDDDLRDITQKHSFNFVNPKAGVYFQANSGNYLYASFAVAHREPNRDNYVDADPAKPSPTKETLYDIEAGHNLKTSSAELTSNIYFMYYHDQLVLTGVINDVGSAIMVNVPESYRAGIEFSSKLKISSKMQWNASATLSRNKIVSFTEYVDNWDDWSQIAAEHRNTDLSFSPSLLANSELAYLPLKGISITLRSKYVGRQYIDNTQAKDRSLDPYFLNSLQLVYALKPHFCNEIVFNLLINNILNHQYESNGWVYRYYSEGRYQVLDGYFPQAGINFMAGITLKL